MKNSMKNNFYYIFKQTLSIIVKSSLVFDLD